MDNMTRFIGCLAECAAANADSQELVDHMLDWLASQACKKLEDALELARLCDLAMRILAAAHKMPVADAKQLCKGLLNAAHNSKAAVRSAAVGALGELAAQQTEQDEIALLEDIASELSDATRDSAQVWQTTAWVHELCAHMLAL